MLCVHCIHPYTCTHSTETAANQETNVQCSRDECGIEPPTTEKQDEDETCTEACAVDPKKSD